jgi:hypothetical protein
MYTHTHTMCLYVRACVRACVRVSDGADERYLSEGPQEGADGGASGGEGGRDEDNEEGEYDVVLTLASGETCVAQSVEELLMSELVCSIFFFMTCVR